MSGGPFDGALREAKPLADITLDDYVEHVAGLMGTIQSDMLARATKLRDDNTHEVESIEDFEKAIDGGWAIAYWDGTDATELAIKERTKATIRIVRDEDVAPGKCVLTGKPAERRALFARAY